MNWSQIRNNFMEMLLQKSARAGWLFYCLSGLKTSGLLALRHPQTGKESGRFCKLIFSTTFFGFVIRTSNVNEKKNEWHKSDDLFEKVYIIANSYYIYSLGRCRKVTSSSNLFFFNSSPVRVKVLGTGYWHRKGDSRPPALLGKVKFPQLSWYDLSHYI